MKKIFIILIIVFAVGMVVVAVYVFKKNKNTTNVVRKHFLSYYIGGQSKIFLDCQEDSDCVLESVNSYCRPFLSINKNNSQSEIKKFNKKEIESIVGPNGSCKTVIPQSLEDYFPVCRQGVCGQEPVYTDDLLGL